MDSPVFGIVSLEDWRESERSLADRAEGWRHMVAEQKRLRAEAYDRAIRARHNKAIVGVWLLITAALIVAAAFVWPEANP